METSVARAHTKRLIREITDPALLDDLLPPPKKLAQMSVTRTDRFFAKVCAAKKVGVVSKFSYGKKIKTYICFSLLTPSGENQLKDRKERMLYGVDNTISLTPRHNEIKWMASFGISHHAVERYFLRSSVQPNSHFKRYLLGFTDECSYLNVEVALLCLLFYPKVAPEIKIDDPDSKVAYAYGDQISVFLPSPNGAFLGTFQYPRLSIQTYLANEDLTSEQVAAKKLVTPFLKAFKDTPVHVPFFSSGNDQSLLEKHGDFAVSLLQYCIGQDANTLISAVTNKLDNWEQYQILEALTDTWGLQNQIHGPAVLEILNQGGFETLFRKAHHGSP